MRLFHIQENDDEEGRGHPWCCKNFQGSIYSVMERRDICTHPYLCQLHVEMACKCELGVFEGALLDAKALYRQRQAYLGMKAIDSIRKFY